MHSSSDAAGAAASSSRKVEANRANAQKSTGSRTEAGKHRSSRNATKHGLLAQVATLLEKPNQELETLIDKYHAEFLPSSTHEEMLVRELAVADWRLKQNARIETGLLSVEMHAVYSNIVNMEKAPLWHEAPPMACPKCGDVYRNEAPGESGPEPAELSEAGGDIHTAVMGAAWANDTAAFALLVRYQGQARRDYFRALKQLELVRTGKVGYLPEKPPSRMGKPLESEVPLAANQTNPTEESYKTAAASSAGQHSNSSGNSGSLEANSAVVSQRVGKSDAHYIASSEEWRLILGAYDGNYDFINVK